MSMWMNVGTNISMSISVYTTTRVRLNTPTCAAGICWCTAVQAGGSIWSQKGRPTAGAKHEAKLPKGEHALQLYSLATPNGMKVTVLLEVSGTRICPEFFNCL